jgi:hypothetical protein
MVQPDKPEVNNLTRRMCFAFWIPKATDTRSEYVTLICFPRQQCLQERPSVLRYSYDACPTISAVNCIIDTGTTFSQS